MVVFQFVMFVRVVPGHAHMCITMLYHSKNETECVFDLATIIVSIIIIIITSLSM